LQEVKISDHPFEFCDMELDNRPGVALGHLETFKNRASFLFKDSLKIARLALVDVSTAEL